MDEDSIRIYKRLAAVTHDEFEQLKSFEVPASDFIDLLSKTLLQKIKAPSEVAEIYKVYGEETIIEKQKD